MLSILVRHYDGSVSVMALLGDALEAATLAPKHIDTIVGAEVAQWSESERATVASWRVIPTDAIPADRTFRGAWTDVTDDASIDFDMEKCREIWKERMRVARAPKLEALDVKFQIALENAEPTTDIVAIKRELRDVTADPGIEAALTPDDLKAVWPDVLNDADDGATAEKR